MQEKKDVNTPSMGSVFQQMQECLSMALGMTSPSEKKIQLRKLLDVCDKYYWEITAIHNDPNRGHISSERREELYQLHEFYNQVIDTYFPYLKKKMDDGWLHLDDRNVMKRMANFKIKYYEGIRDQLPMHAEHANGKRD